jgi:PAS domain S-box-containing protein
MRDANYTSSNSVFEVTSQKLADRRTSMLNTLAAVPAQTVDVVLEHILTALGTNPNDIPLVMLYKFEQGAGSSALRLQGHIGLPKGHGLIIDSADIEDDEGLIPDMRRAGSEAVIIKYDDRFNSATWSGWGSPSKKIAILPIIGGVGRHVFGYLVIGTNPYRPHDEFGKQFIRDVNRMVSSIVSAAVDFEDTRRRQEKLEAHLAFSDLKLRHLIDHASVGMCHISIDGHMLWANDQYYHLSGRTAEEHEPQNAFFDAYAEEDRPKAKETFANLLAGGDHVSIELRLKRMYKTPNDEIEPAYLQVLAFPYHDPETGQVQSVMACTTDISKLRWAQSFQARLAVEAREAKRQTEAFIDVGMFPLQYLHSILHARD